MLLRPGDAHLTAIVPAMTGLDIADRARARTHHERRGACAASKILYAVYQITCGDTCGGKANIIATDQIVNMEDPLQINAVAFQLLAFLIVTWPDLTLNLTIQTFEGCSSQNCLRSSTNAHEDVDAFI